MALIYLVCTNDGSKTTKQCFRQKQASECAFLKHTEKSSWAQN